MPRLLWFAQQRSSLRATPALVLTGRRASSLPDQPARGPASPRTEYFGGDTPFTSAVLYLFSKMNQGPLPVLVLLCLSKSVSRCLNSFDEVSNAIHARSGTQGPVAYFVVFES
ncbi:hypothetical protein IQ07DRAFT_82061 [Pyrenochaeta sp. DS3sAY3a]|nr:hypothetical protein IQ07DRAFT_82061 [Pyrenochaeta sp. DS3sAY3a]